MTFEEKRFIGVCKVQKRYKIFKLKNLKNEIQNKAEISNKH